MRTHLLATALATTLIAASSASASPVRPLQPHAWPPHASVPYASSSHALPSYASSSSEVSAYVEAALAAIADDVGRTSHESALKIAFTAYYNYREANPDRVRKPYLYFVDYGLDNFTARGWVFDMQTLRVVEGAFMVAHGRGSSTGRNGVPTRFSNVEGSAATSLGLYIAQETYAFSGKSNGRRYSSIGLRMDGVSGRYNSRARERGVVVHGAPYVTANGSGRSEGCPAMEQFRAKKLIPMIADGGMVFLFSPRDSGWLARDPWANPSPRA